MPTDEVVICGAGAAGLTLARLLGNQGRRVLVLERDRAFREAFKGEVLQPRALRVFEAAGVLEAVQRHGVRRADRFTACDAEGRVLCALDYGTLDKGHDHLLVQGYREMQSALAEELPASVTLRHGVSVQEPLIDGGRVVGVRARTGGHTIDFPASLVVACDGRNSKLRRTADLPVTTERYPHEFIGFDLSDMDLGPELQAFTSPGGVVLLFPLADRHARLYVQSEAGVFRHVESADVPSWLTSVVARVPALRPWAEQFRLGAGTARILPIWRHQATRWGRPGLALAGDAAHCVHPMAGQGMAAAADDAWVLAARLSALPDLTPPLVDAAIEEYERARAVRQAYVDRLSHSMAMLLCGTSRFQHAFCRYELGVISRNRWLRETLVHNISGAGIRRYNAFDRAASLGVPDPRRRRRPPLRTDDLAASCDPRVGTAAPALKEKS